MENQWTPKCWSFLSETIEVYFEVQLWFNSLGVSEIPQNLMVAYTPFVVKPCLTHSWGHYTPSAQISEPPPVMALNSFYWASFMISFTLVIGMILSIYNC
jgi:hypothetical protein